MAERRNWFIAMLCIYLVDGEAECGVCGAFPVRKHRDGAGERWGSLVLQQPGVLLEETSPSDGRGVRNCSVYCSLSVFVKHVQ